MMMIIIITFIYLLFLGVLILRNIEFAKRIFYFILQPKKFEEETFRFSGNLLAQEDKEGLKKNITKLRKYVGRAFMITILALIFASFTNVIFKIYHISVVSQVIATIGYFLILFGVLSHFGYELQTWNHETLPEIFNEELHKILYFLGASCIMFNYFYMH